MVINNRSVTDLLIASRGCQIMNLIKTCICPLGFFALFSLNNAMASATRFDQSSSSATPATFLHCLLPSPLPSLCHQRNPKGPRVAPWSLGITSHASLSNVQPWPSALLVPQTSRLPVPSTSACDAAPCVHRTLVARPSSQATI